MLLIGFLQFQIFWKNINLARRADENMKNLNIDDIRRLNTISQKVRKKCLEIAFKNNPKATHFGGGMSTIEILVFLFFQVLNYKVESPHCIDRDRFFLSKGHSVLGYYSVLHLAGYLSEIDLETYGANNTIIPGHPVMNKQKGIEFTNGSLGMGLSVALGHSIAIKKLNLNADCFVLMGDGECNEGSVWEALMAAPHFNIGNLTAIIDRNRLQQTGSGDVVMDLEPLGTKLRAFGWEVFEVDGHDFPQLASAFEMRNTNLPTAIIANTIKGKGFSFSENNNAFHHGVITKKLFDQGLQELEN